MFSVVQWEFCKVVKGIIGQIIYYIGYSLQVVVDYLLVVIVGFSDLIEIVVVYVKGGFC